MRKDNTFQRSKMVSINFQLSKFSIAAGFRKGMTRKIKRDFLFVILIKFSFNKLNSHSFM